MKKFINDPKDLVSEMIYGFLQAFGGSFDKIPGRNGIVVSKREERVSVVTGGGSGGEPWCIGAVGDGLADGVAIGNIFAAPAATTIAEVCKHVYHDKGVLLVTGNHTGDALNFELAAELAEIDSGIECKTVLVMDDLGSSGHKEERSGNAGIGIVVFLASAAAKEGNSLEKVWEIAQKVNRNLSTLSAVTKLGANPATGLPMGEIAEDAVHIGVGVTGEPGIFEEKFSTAKDIAERLMDLLTADLQLKPGDETALFINGGGTVTVLEELIMCGHVCRYLRDRGIAVFDVDVTERLKVEKTESITVSVLKLDEELKKYITATALTPLIAKHHYGGGQLEHT